MKPRVRLYAAGQTMFRQVRKDKGYRGAYGMTRSPAKWACITCGRLIDGDDKAPWVARNTWLGEAWWVDVCARNGHAPCAYCGKQLPRLNDGCPRAHPWKKCPGKTEDDRKVGQHSHPAQHERHRP